MRMTPRIKKPKIIITRTRGSNPRVQSGFDHQRGNRFVVPNRVEDLPREHKREFEGWAGTRDQIASIKLHRLERKTAMKRWPLRVGGAVSGFFSLGTATIEGNKGKALAVAASIGGMAGLITAWQVHRVHHKLIHAAHESLINSLGEYARTNRGLRAFVEKNPYIFVDAKGELVGSRIPKMPFGRIRISSKKILAAMNGNSPIERAAKSVTAITLSEGTPVKFFHVQRWHREVSGGIPKAISALESFMGGPGREVLPGISSMTHHEMSPRVREFSENYHRVVGDIHDIKAQRREVLSDTRNYVKGAIAGIPTGIAAGHYSGSISGLIAGVAAPTIVLLGLKRIKVTQQTRALMREKMQELESGLTRVAENDAVMRAMVESWRYLYVNEEGQIVGTNNPRFFGIGHMRIPTKRMVQKLDSTSSTQSATRLLPLQ